MEDCPDLAALSYIGDRASSASRCFPRASRYTFLPAIPADSCMSASDGLSLGERLQHRSVDAKRGAGNAVVRAGTTEIYMTYKLTCDRSCCLAIALLVALSSCNAQLGSGSSSDATPASGTLVEKTSNAPSDSALNGPYCVLTRVRETSFDDATTLLSWQFKIGEIREMAVRLVVLKKGEPSGVHEINLTWEPWNEKDSPATVEILLLEASAKSSVSPGPLVPRLAVDVEGGPRRTTAVANGVIEIASSLRAGERTVLSEADPVGKNRVLYEQQYEPPLTPSGDAPDDDAEAVRVEFQWN